MKILISYFYQIRFFKHNYIPISTAYWGPKWFTKNDRQYKDKNGVWNGIEAVEFMPGEECANLCRGPERCNKIVDDCAFKTTYRKQLDRLNFNAIMEKFKVLGTKVKEVEGFSEEPVCVLIVYEKPDNPCSERKVLQSWFRDNGYELEEFNKELI